MDQGQGLVVLFGGTGVIGRELARSAQTRGASVLSISLDSDHESPTYTNRFLDLASAPSGAVTRLIQRHCGDALQVSMMVDVVGLGTRQIDEVSDYAASTGAGLALISSSLLYRPRADGIYDDTAETVGSDDPALFPYQKLKLAQEEALSKRTDVDWRIFRTNHVIGRGGLLGCIPDHNRDRTLLDRIARGAPLRLARKGDIRLSFIHARDLAEGLLQLSSVVSTTQKVLNLVHPVPAQAAEYFSLLAQHLGAPEPIIEEHQPEQGSFWTLTAADKILISSRAELEQVRFQFDLSAALSDALQIDPERYASLGTFMAQRIKSPG